MTPAPVIIFDGETRSALTALRSLTERAIPVVVASHKKKALSFSSRYCIKKLVYPSPGTHRATFLDFMAKYLKENPNVLCMTFTDTTTDALHTGIAQGLIPKNVFFGPTLEQYMRATDKRVLATIASGLDISVPVEIVDFDSDSTHDLQFPLIIKPARSVSWNGECAYKDTARFVTTHEECMQQYHALSGHVDRAPLMQKVIVGDEYGLSLLAVQGEIYTLFAHKRLRSITPQGGASALRESVAVTAEMETIAKKLVGALSWNGVMMIELKHNTQTQKLTLIEINARFWGSLFLAITAGVDFPYLLYVAHYGTLQGIVPHYKVGIRARHLVSDLRHFYALRLKAFHPSHISAFCTFFQKKMYYDVWSFHDPLPGIMEFTQAMREKI